MHKAQIKYLQEVDGHLLYRRRVPQDLKSYLGKGEWVHALGLARGQEAHAAKIIADYNIVYANLIAKMRLSQVTGSEFSIVAQPRPVEVEPVNQITKEPTFQPEILISDA